MSDYFPFNGDADGLCALQQLRLAEAPRAALVTGVKRDIALLRRVQASRGERVTVLDLSLAQNRDDVLRLLQGGARLRYFDHHFAGELPAHPGFEAHIDTAAEVCTSALVNRYLQGRHQRWAVVGASGDAMQRLGQALAQGQGLTAGELGRLEQLGRYLNYNAYGESLADLHFDPAALAEALAPYADPLDFIRASPVFAALHEGYAADMLKAETLAAEREVAGAWLFRLPDAAWARRVSGVLANELLRKRPEQALALLSPLSGGGFSVSLRVPASHDLGADDFCRRYATGGGRKRAAGINLLPETAIERFAGEFEAAFGAA